MCSVNGKFLAVVLEAQGGGAFLVAPLTAVSANSSVYHLTSQTTPTSVLSIGKDKCPCNLFPRLPFFQLHFNEADVFGIVPMVV